MLVRRKIASILVNGSKTYIKSGSLVLPLWDISDHLSHIERFDYTDIILTSKRSSDLLKININKDLNYIAALPWSSINDVEYLFKWGYSKVFLGGKSHVYPTSEQNQEFIRLVSTYGASAFGHTLHIDSDKEVLINYAYYSNFSEILLIDNILQLSSGMHNVQPMSRILSDIASNLNLEINLLVPSVVFHSIYTDTCLNVNFVNYCEHARGCILNAM